MNILTIILTLLLICILAAIYLQLMPFKNTKTPFTDDLPLPKLVVFDLDYTLWPFWCDTHVSPPLRPSLDGDCVLDKYGDQFQFYPAVPAIFKECREHEIGICAASRTHMPRVAQSLLSLLKIDDEPSSAYFDFTAWGTGSKIRHFQELHLHTDVDYEDMVFFDDESRNRDVERQLGVTFVDCSSGMSMELFHKGVELWRKKNGISSKGKRN